MIHKMTHSSTASTTSSTVAVTVPNPHKFSHQELAGILLPKLPAVWEVGDGCPKCDIVRVVVSPARARILDIIHKIRIVIVVDGVAVDVAHCMPHVTALLDHTPLYPEFLHAAKGFAVELLEAVFVDDAYVVLYDGERIILGQLGAHAGVEEHFVELSGNTLGVDFLLQEIHVVVDKQGRKRCGKLLLALDRTP